MQGGPARSPARAFRALEPPGPGGQGGKLLDGPGGLAGGLVAEAEGPRLGRANLKHQTIIIKEAGNDVTMAQRHLVESYLSDRHLVDTHTVFYQYSVHFFTWKMMLKYFLHIKPAI